MAAGAHGGADVVRGWLDRFEAALGDGDEQALAGLFHPDGYWRDVLALTWDIRTACGREAILAELPARGRRARPRGLHLDPARIAPRTVTRAGSEALEAFFAFTVEAGRGNGVLRLVADPGGGGVVAWTLFTALDSLAGHEERLGAARPRGQAYSRDFRGPNWLDQRCSSAAYEDRDPAVLVVGGGQAGLSIAARLGQLRVDTLVVDRGARIGDNWRKRYHALTLHNQVQVNHLPYMPFPPNWPTYIPKDKLAGWFEAYVEAMELNYWTATEVERGRWDAAARRWEVSLRRGDGGCRTLRPRHIVMAAGVSSIPRLPDIPSLKDFAGEVTHAAHYQDGEAWAGRRALVIGTGNSGHDIAQDLHASGAHVTMVQRSPTMVVNIEPSAQLPYALYDEGPSLEECDLITASMPLPLVRRAHIRFTAQARELDRDLLEGLRRAGFVLDFGEDGSGWQFKYLTRGGGYYFNVGCSDLIAAGAIGLKQFADVERFVPEGVRLRDGAILAADLVVLATGYEGQGEVVRRLLGEEVAARIGPVWGFGEGQELRNMFVRTPQPGLWFIAGSLAQCRIYSKYLALQIKASEVGVLRERTAAIPSSVPGAGEGENAPRSGADEGAGRETDAAIGAAMPQPA